MVIDIFIAGAQKSGTTALASFIDKHPNVEVARGKELHLFDSSDYSSELVNSSLIDTFPNPEWGGPEKLFCDATPYYLYDERSIKRMAIHNRDAKILVVLRNTTERALSQYNMERKRGDEHWPLLAALLLERFRIRSDFGRRHHSYLDRGWYSKQLTILAQYFPEKNILILTSEDLRENHDATLERVCEFLQIPYSHFSTSEAIFSGGKKQLTPLSRLYLQARYRKEEKERRRFLFE